MRLQVVVAIVVLVPALAAAQNRRPDNKQQPPQQQFTQRFNPNENKPSQSNDFGNQQQQQQQQQHQQQPLPQARASNDNNFREQSRESTTFIPIIRFDNEKSVEGGYKTLWETGNNILVEETGVLKSFGNDKDNAEAVVQQGSYSYTSPEGQQINVQYTADERGFRATGDHLPTPPPIPAEIQKSLDLIYSGIRQQQNQPNQNNANINQQQYNEDGQYNDQSNEGPDNRQYNNDPSNNRRQDNINFRPSNSNNRNNQQNFGSNNNNRG